MLALDESGGRRVTQCACWQSRRWAGYAGAIAAGWHASYVHGPRGHRRVWVCPECYVPPAPIPPERLESIAVAKGVRGDVALDVGHGDAGWPRDVAMTRNLIARLCEIDPRRGRAYLEMVLEVIGPSNKPAATKWWKFVEAQVVEHGLALALPARKARSMHFSGALELKDGRGTVITIVAGWAACCSGKRAETIRAAGETTPDPSLVTCSKCLARMGKAFRQRWVVDRIREDNMALPVREFAEAIHLAEKRMPLWMRAAFAAAAKHGPSARLASARYRVDEKRWVAIAE